MRNRASTPTHIWDIIMGHATGKLTHRIVEQYTIQIHCVVGGGAERTGSVRVANNVIAGFFLFV